MKRKIHTVKTVYELRPTTLKKLAPKLYTSGKAQKFSLNDEINRARKEHTGSEVLAYKIAPQVYVPYSNN